MSPTEFGEPISPTISTVSRSRPGEVRGGAAEESSSTSAPSRLEEEKKPESESKRMKIEEEEREEMDEAVKVAYEDEPENKAA